MCARRWRMCQLLLVCSLLAGCDQASNAPVAKTSRSIEASPTAGGGEHVAAPGGSAASSGVSQGDVVSPATSPDAAPAAPNTTTPTDTAPPLPFVKQVSLARGLEYEPLELVHFQEVDPLGVITRLEALADGKQVLVVGTAGAVIVPLGSGEALAQVPFKASADSTSDMANAGVAPDRTWLCAPEKAEDEWQLTKRKLPTLEVLASVKLQGSPVQAGLAVSTDGQELALSQPQSPSSIEIRDAGTLEVKREIAITGSELRGMFYVGEHQLLTLGTANRIWDTTTGELVHNFADEVYGSLVELSPNGRELLLGKQSFIAVWDLQQKKSIGEYVGSLGGALSGQFSSDGKLLAVHFPTGLSIWDTATRVPLQIIERPGSSYGKQAFRWIPNTQSLLIAEDFGPLRVWGRRAEADKLGLPPLPPPSVIPLPEELNANDLLNVVDLRLLPWPAERIWDTYSFGVPSATFDSYQANAALKTVLTHYEKLLPKLGWQLVPPPAGTAEQPNAGSLNYVKQGHRLGIQLYSDAPDRCNVSLNYGGNLDLKSLPWPTLANPETEFGGSPVLIKSFDTSLLAAECAVIRALTQANWVLISRVGSAGDSEAQTRTIEFLKGHHLLNVFIRRDEESAERCSIHYSSSVTLATFPTPPDVQAMEWDDQRFTRQVSAVAHTKLSLQATEAFYVQALAARGWQQRTVPASKEPKERYLAFYRDQDDLRMGLTELPTGEVQIAAGPVLDISWQLAMTKDDGNASGAGDTSESTNSESPDQESATIEVADLPIIAASGPVEYEQQGNRLRYPLDKTPLAEVAKQFTEKLAAMGWEATDFGEPSETQHHLGFKKGDSTLYYQSSIDPTGEGSVRMNCEGFRWNKPLPVPAQPMGYFRWLQHNKLKASLEPLDRFEREMEELIKSRPVK